MQRKETNKMENELIKIENNELELTNEGIKFIKKMQKTKIELAKMEENGITKYISPDGLFKVTYYKSSKTQRFDSTTFKKENQDLYNKYLVDSERKAYVKFN